MTKEFIGSIVALSRTGKSITIGTMTPSMTAIIPAYALVYPTVVSGYCVEGYAGRLEIDAEVADEKILGLPGRKG